MIWIAWEDHRRSRELAKHLGCDLHLFCDTGKFRYLKSLVKTAGLIIKRRPKILFVQNPSMILAAFASLCHLLMKDLFLVVDRHTTFRLGKPFRLSIDWIIFKMLNHFTLRTADLTLVTNDFLSQIVSEKGGKSFVLPDKLPGVKSGQTICLPSGTLNLLLISSFAPDEPVAEVIEAMCNLPSDIVRLYVTGDHAKLPASIKEKTPGNVIFTGYLPESEFFAYLNSVDGVLALTTADHCVLCACNEALSAEKPLITSDKEVLRQYFPGSIFVHNNDIAIANGIIELLKNKEKYIIMATKLKIAMMSEWNQRMINLKQQLNDYQHF